MDKAAGIEVSVQVGLEQLSRTAAKRIVGIAATAVRERGRFCLNLSGGTTPRRLYSLLGGEFKNKVPWSRTHLFWGDERYVPRDDPRSNFRMAVETLISRIPIPDGNVHSVPVERSPVEAAAEAYESHLRDFFEKKESAVGPVFDVTLLGMGEDGHTASLFPGSSALDEMQRWVVAVTAPPGIEPPQRITMTLPILNRSNFIFFLVSGERKRPAATSILMDADAASRYPAAHVRGAMGAVWFVDPSIIRE
jgi:6-phosphogluconolactonase